MKISFGTGGGVFLNEMRVGSIRYDKEARVFLYTIAAHAANNRVVPEGLKVVLSGPLVAPIQERLRKAVEAALAEGASL